VGVRVLAKGILPPLAIDSRLVLVKGILPPLAIEAVKKP